MEILLGVFIGAIIVLGVLAWSLRHPSPFVRPSDYQHGWDGGESYGSCDSSHHTDHCGSSDPGAFC